jgi:hypothetical protein
LRLKARGGATILVLGLLGLLAIPSASIPQADEKLVALTFTDQPGANLRTRNGWFRTSVVVHWNVQPWRGLVRTVGCEPAILVRAETSGRTFTCEALWSDGTRVRRSTAPPVRLDRTPPYSVRAVRGRLPDSYGWYGSPVRFTFTGRDARSGIAFCTRRIYRGPNTWRARVTGTCVDRAGNRSAPRTVFFRYQSPLLRPRAGTRVTWAPLLDWIPVSRAQYYNVQVWRSGRQILNRWPRASRLRMPSTWVNGGVRYWISTPGRYKWYVWPRFQGRYGRMIGSSYFIRE